MEKLIWFFRTMWRVIYPPHVNISVLIVLYLVINICLESKAQSYLSIEGQLGYSRPIGVWEKEKNQVYDFNGVVGNNILLRLNHESKKNLFLLNLGIYTFGYETFTTQGFTSAMDFPEAGNGLPIDYKQKYIYRYYGLGIGYGMKFKKRNFIELAFNYLVPYKIIYEQTYSFPNPNLNVDLKFISFFQYVFHRNDKVFYQYKNQGVFRLKYKYEMSNFASFSASYLIGTKEFILSNPVNSNLNIHQFIGLGLECRISKRLKFRKTS